MNKYQIKDPRNGNPITFEAKTDEEANEMQRLILSEIDQGRKALTYAMTRDGGRVLSANGKLMYTSSGMATSNPQKIAKILESERTNGDTARQMAESEISEEIVSAQELPARLSKYVQGVPFVGEYVDEAVGAMGDERSAEKIRTLQKSMQTARPYESAGLQVAGGLTAAPLMPTLGSTGTTLEKAVKTGTKGGLFASLEGLVSGFGSGEDTDERIQAAKERATIGGIAGGGTGVLSPYASDLTSRGVNAIREMGSDAINRVKSVFNRSSAEDLATSLGISREASTVIKNALDAGGTVEDAVTAIRKAGDQGMIADANEATKTLLDAVMATGSRANVIGEEAVSGRLATTAGKASQALDETLGVPPMGRESVSKSIAQSTMKDRSEAYGKAYATQVPYTQPQAADIVDVLSRIPDKVKARAIESANMRMRAESNDNIIPQEIILKDRGDGVLDFVEMPSVMQLDYIKRALDSMGKNFTDADANTYGLFAKQLRDATVKAVPEFGEALKRGADKIGMDEAFDLGYNILNRRTTRENVIKSLDGATDVEKQLAKTGIRTFIDETLSNIRSGITGSTEEIAEARNLLRLLSDRASLDKLSQVLDTRELNQVMGALRELRSAFEMRASTTAGSRTAIRQDVQRGIDEMTEPSFVRMAQSGNPIDATRRVVSVLTGMTDEFTESQRQAIMADIARGLTEKRGKDAQVALRYIQKAIESGKMDATRAKFVSDVVARAMTTGATLPENIKGN